jgi:hypothetical protein
LLIAQSNPGGFGMATSSFDWLGLESFIAHFDDIMNEVREFEELTYTKERNQIVPIQNNLNSTIGNY